MKFFYNPGSSNSRRAEAVIRHLGLQDIEMVLLNHFQGEHRTPEFQAINPNVQIPALQDGDLKLWESNAIMQYLAEGSSLYPDDPKVRADIARWQFWTSFNFGPTTAALIFERAFKAKMGMGEPDPALIAAESAKLDTFCTLLDTHLADRDYLVGDGLTIADFAVCAEMSFNDLGQLDMSGYPNLMAWAARLDALPAWQETVIRFGGVPALIAPGSCAPWSGVVAVGRLASSCCGPTPTVDYGVRRRRHARRRSPLPAPRPRPRCAPRR